MPIHQISQLSIMKNNPKNASCTFLDTEVFYKCVYIYIHIYILYIDTHEHVHTGTHTHTHMRSHTSTQTDRQHTDRQTHTHVSPPQTMAFTHLTVNDKTFEGDFHDLLSSLIM